MLKIRLSRIGKKNEPRFRVVVALNTAPPRGKFIESLGFYNPHDKTFKIDEEKVKLWLSRGAKPSPTVHNKLVDLGIIKDKKIKTSKKKRKKPAQSEALGRARQTAELSAGKKLEEAKEVEKEAKPEAKSAEAKRRREKKEEKKEETRPKQSIGAGPPDCGAVGGKS